MDEDTTYPSKFFKSNSDIHTFLVNTEGDCLQMLFYSNSGDLELVYKLFPYKNAAVLKLIKSGSVEKQYTLPVAYEDRNLVKNLCIWLGGKAF